MPGSGEVARRTPVALARGTRALAPTLLAAVILAVWLALDPRTPDLAAAVYRQRLYGDLGFAIFDTHWYAGHALPGYSLLFPPLASLIGTRTLAALCALASTAIFTALVGEVYGRRAWWAALWFAVAAAADVWVGRLAFALGVTLALAAALAWSRRARPLAPVLAAACAAASPVAGALLGLAGLTDALVRRSPRALLGLALPPAAVVAALALLFPEGGFEPYPLVPFTATVGVVAAFVWALPAEARHERTGALAYLLACVAFLLVRTQMGSNVERYAVLLAGPVLIAARLREPARRLLTPAVVVSLCASGALVLWGPLRETRAVAGSEATSAAYYAPLERFLAGRGAVRVEVPFTRSHWEAALLAPDVPLARGWEKQLDERYDGALLSPGLDAASYERWLDAQAVGYVALPDVRLDPSSAREGSLIRGGLPFLREVMRSRHWRVFQVRGGEPLAHGPGRLLWLGHDAFGLQANAAGRFLVRVRFTRYWTLTRSHGCVEEAPGGWTAVNARSAGTVQVAARFSLSGALGERSCR